MSNFNPDNAVAVNETSQGTMPADTESFNVDRAVPINETNSGNTNWESFKQDDTQEPSNETNTVNNETNPVNNEIKPSTMPQDNKNSKVSTPSVTSADNTKQPNPGLKEQGLNKTPNVSRETQAVKPHQTVPSPDYPPENWLNATVHSAEGAVWNSFVKPFSKPQPDMDQYLDQLQKKHPIASIIGGTAPFIVSAPFLPESLVPNVYLRTAAQFGLVGLGQGITRARQDQSKQMTDKASDVAQETLKQMAYGPVFAKAQTLQILDRPFATALARAGVISGGSGVMSAMFGDNLNDAFKQGGLYGALSLMAEAPHLAGTVLGRGIIAHANNIYADMRSKAGLPDIKIDVDANYKPEATEDLTTKKYHVREISDLLSSSEAGGLIKSDEGEYSRLQSGWPSFLTDRGYSRDDLNNIFDKFLSDKELTEKQQSTLNTILKDAEPFTKGLTPLQKQIHTMTTAMAEQVPGIHDPQIISATVKLPDGTQIHGSSHDDALSKIGETKKSMTEVFSGKTVQRIEEKGTDLNLEKPQGLYTSPADLKSPHEELGGKKYLLDRNKNAKVLSITGGTDRSIAIRKDANSAGAGVWALRHIVGKEEFENLKSKTKQELIKDLENKYPEVNWNKYYDKQEVLEAFGAIKARESGYDAIDLKDSDMPEFSEYVGLGKKAFSSDPKEFNKVYQSGFTVINPDGTTKFITREESMQKPFNLPNGESEDVKGLNESKWMTHEDPEITNPDTLAMMANNEGKVDIGMIPGVPETAEMLKKSHDELKEKFLPYTVGREGQLTAEVIRENLGVMARNFDRLENTLSQAKKMFDRADKNSSLEFIYRMEEGKEQETKDLQKVADVLRSLLDTKRDEIRALGTGKLENFIENYFPHVWEDPNKVGMVIKRIMGKRPFAGPASFLKKRTIPTTREGIDLGFTPVSYNPIDSVLLKTREMERYLMAHRSIQALKDQSIIQFVRTGNKPPDGFVPIDDRFAQVTYKNDAKELVLAGKYMAQKDAGRILNNYLSPGLRGKSYIYDMYREAGNTLNQFQLGISAFHLGFTSMDATISKFALGLNKLSTGDFAGAIKEFGRAPFAPITNIMQGRELLQAWYGRDMGPLTNAIADVMASAGGRAKMDKFYATGMADSMNKSLKEGKLLTAALKVPFYIVDQMARPIMEYVVPRQKMGVFMDMMKMEMERNPDITHEQLRTTAQKAWDSVDNRMGQLVYDNLFWHHITKDLAMASVRSLGWNLGTVREIGGGVKDVIGNVEDIIHGRGTKVSYRTAYVMALPIVTGLYGAIYQYLHTGQAPQSIKDYFFPRNGAIDNKGQPARISLPTYMKDIYHYTTNPVQTVINKFSPVNNAVMEMLANKDYYGTQIRNVDDPIMQQVLDELTFVGGEFEPFGFRNLGRDTRTSAGSKIEPFIGITPAPYDINMTKAEREAYELAKGKVPVGSRTKEQAQHSQAKSKLASDYMVSKNPSVLDKGVDQGLISAKERRQIMKLSTMSNLARLTRDLSVEEVQHVLKYASDQERPELRSILEKKLVNKENRSGLTEAEEKLYDQTFNP